MEGQRFELKVPAGENVVQVYHDLYRLAVIKAQMRLRLTQAEKEFLRAGGPRLGSRPMDPLE